MVYYMPHVLNGSEEPAVKQSQTRNNSAFLMAPMADPSRWWIRDAGRRMMLVDS